MECHACNKELFLSLSLARNAAIIYSWIYHKEYDTYECPVRSGDYHLSTLRWRSQQFAEALKPPVTGQERP
jgi:hypothetical protein